MLSDENMIVDLLAILKMLPPSPYGPLLSKIFLTFDWIHKAFLPLLNCFSDYPGDLMDLEARDKGRELLKALLNHGMDLVEASYKSGTDRSIHLKDKVGEVAFQPLLMLLQRMKDHGLVNKRLAAQLLCQLCTKSKPNAQLLRGRSPAGSADHPDKKKYHSLRDSFVETLHLLLPDCGDFATQNFLLESLYRMIRNTLHDVNDSHMTVLMSRGGLLKAGEGGEARQRFEELILNDNTKDLDLDAELREVIDLFNQQLGPRAT